MVCIPYHRLRVSLLLKRWAILLEYCLLASLMPRDRLALAVFSPPHLQLWRQRSSLQESVDLPCQPRLLVGPDSDSLCDRYIINTLGDVGSDSLWVLLEVCGVVVCGSLFKHIPVSDVKTVLKCLWRPFRPHLYLFVYWFDDFSERSVCRH